MTIMRMDNVLIVVDDLEAVKAFFIELGLSVIDSQSRASYSALHRPFRCPT